jgi:enoyl-CoA hydratase
MAKIRVEDDGTGVHLLTLTDPERRNALGDEMGAAILSVLTRLRADSSVRVLVVTGEGTTFCAGADLPQLFGDPALAVSERHERLQGYYRAFLAMRDLPFPTIAAVNGAAVGAGLNLALACDLRIAGPHASFGATFARIGLHPGGGCTWFLVRALGASRALRTLLLGEVLDSGAAVRLGLADGPEDDPVAAALELARRIAETEPRLARHIKRAVRLAVETDDLGAVLEYESWAQAASAASPQLQEWVARFRE